MWFTCFGDCVKNPAKSKELQIRFRFIVRERASFREQMYDRLLPIRLVANPGRDCKDVTIRPSYIKSRLWNSLANITQNGMGGTIAHSVILSAVNDDDFNSNLTEEEKVAFCEGK